MKTDEMAGFDGKVDTECVPSSEPKPAYEVMFVSPDALKGKVAIISISREVGREASNLLGQAFTKFAKEHLLAGVFIMPDAKVTFLDDVQIEKLGDDFMKELKKV